MEAVFYPSASSDGYLYFSATEGRDSELYRCKVTGNTATSPEKLPFNNSQFRDLDPMVAPDGSFLVFSIQNRGATPGAALYISFRQGDGWSEPQALGPNVNGAGGAGQAGLSPDGTVLYFTSRAPVPPAPRTKRANARQLERELLSYENGLGNIYSVRINDLLPSQL